MSRYPPASSNNSTRSSRVIAASRQTFSSTRSYASLISVLPRSNRNQVIIGLPVAGLPVAGNPATGNWQLHPEDPEPRSLDGRVVRNRESEAKVHPRLRGIVDAVVPQPRRAVIRTALAFVLLENG